MSYVLKDIEYKGIFKYFEEISNIPRGSGNMRQISDYLVNFAKSHNLKYIQDELLNVIIYKEASKGYEQFPTIVLQGHMDMVCEKDENIEHDFLKDKIELIVEEDILKANGTTLGGDDGIAIAYALAILDSDEFKHPKLEIVITVDEETGMYGANALNPSLINGKYMINIDSEMEGVILTSCAGGMTADCKLKIDYEKQEGRKYTIRLGGFLGGHSGEDINKNRNNATLILARILFMLSNKINFYLIDFNSGTKENAIPRDAQANIIADNDIEKNIKIIQECFNIIRSEINTAEKDIYIKIECDNNNIIENVITNECYNKLINLFLSVPNGVQVMSCNYDNLVESSLNLGICNIKNGEAIFSYSIRSSKNSYKKFLSDKVKFIIKSLGGEFSIHGEYPAWEFKENSKLLDLMKSSYVEMFGSEPEIKSIHAGLECGIISSKIQDIDIVSIGCNITDLHSPKERMSIQSAKRMFDYIIKVLENTTKL